MHAHSSAERGCPFSSQDIAPTFLAATLADVLYPPLTQGVLLSGASFCKEVTFFLSQLAALGL